MSAAPDPNQLNEYVRPILSPFLMGDYRLDERGQKQVIRANADLGRDYAEMQNLPVADWCFRDLEKKLQLMPPHKLDCLLDVCAGTGFVSLNLMRRKLFRKCIALDINEEALAILRQRANKLNITGIETQRGDIMQTQFAEGSLDCVMGNSFLHHLPDNEQFLREMYRILKPGGTLCLTHEPSVTAVQLENWIPRKIAAIGIKRKNQGEQVLTDIWQYRSATIRALLLSIGFQEVSIQGRGLVSTVVGTFFDRIWIRLTGRMTPSPLYVFRRLLGWCESFFVHHSHTDAFASLTISARK